MKKRIVLIVSALLLILVTAFVTYRITMHSISVKVSEDTVQLTAFGQVDEYDFEYVDMSPSNSK